jgi:hypothetical protein
MFGLDIDEDGVEELHKWSHFLFQVAVKVLLKKLNATVTSTPPLFFWGGGGGDIKMYSVI